MISTQINACCSHVKLHTSPAFCYLSPVTQLRTSPNLALPLPHTRPRLISTAQARRTCAPICLFGGEGKSKKDNETSPWGALEKAMGGFRKERSIEDLLKDQMQEREFDGDGGGAGKPPGGGGDGFGNSEDEGFEGIFDELLQVILATTAFILMYVYILTGEEIIKVVKDYIKYLFGGRKSVRLKKNMFMWGRLYRRLTEKPQPAPRDWLERTILMTPTLWYDPKQMKRMRRRPPSRPAPSYQYS